jgi:hypothetical protein
LENFVPVSLPPVVVVPPEVVVVGVPSLLPPLPPPQLNMPTANKSNAIIDKIFLALGMFSLLAVFKSLAD